MLLKEVERLLELVTLKKLEGDKSSSYRDSNSS